jgi:hypothetical protein
MFEKDYGYKKVWEGARDHRLGGGGGSRQGRPIDGWNGF